MDDGGFVGTTNFDHRSRLPNNEMGFFLESEVYKFLRATGIDKQL